MIVFILVFALLASACTLATDYAVKGRESVSIAILASLRDQILRWLVVIGAGTAVVLIVTRLLSSIIRWLF